MKLFSFTDLFDLTCDLDNYKDDTHYSEQISADIMNWIHDGTCQMTEANYKSRIENMTDYYLHYNYSKSGIPLAQEN